MPWFKVDCGWWLTDWIVPLSSESQLCWLRLIEYVKEKGTRGSARAISPSVAARIWMVGEESIRKLLEAAHNSGAVSTVDGDWVLNNWNQYQSDPSAAERQAQSRAKRGIQVQTTTESRPVTACHSDIRESRLEERRGEESKGEDFKAKSKPAKSKAKPESESEVWQYAQSIGLPEHEAKKWLDRNEAIGWVTGKAKTPVKDWKASLRTWLNNYNDFKGSRQTPPPSSAAPLPAATPDELAQMRGFINHAHYLANEAAKVKP